MAKIGSKRLCRACWHTEDQHAHYSRHEMCSVCPDYDMHGFQPVRWFHWFSLR